MFRFAERFPGLAFIFEQEPSLWMCWTVRPGAFNDQRPEVRFSMNYWARLYRMGRYPRIEIRGLLRPLHLENLVQIIPSPSIPFIKSLYLRVSLSSYCLYSFETFLPELRRLEHLKLIVQSGGIFAGDHLHQQNRSFTDHRPISRQCTAIRSLCVNNIAIFPGSLSTERWSHITSLHLAFGLRRAMPSTLR